MALFRQIWGLRVSSERFDVRLGQWVCFAAGPALLVVTVSGLARLSPTPAEAFLGVLAGVAAALQLVILGIVLPLAQAGAPPSQAPQPTGPATSTPGSPPVTPAGPAVEL
jgi:hypothetical protein